MGSLWIWALGLDLPYFPYTPMQTHKVEETNLPSSETPLHPLPIPSSLFSPHDFQLQNKQHFCTPHYPVYLINRLDHCFCVSSLTTLSLVPSRNFFVTEVSFMAITCLGRLLSFPSLCRSYPFYFQLVLKWRCLKENHCVGFAQATASFISSNGEYSLLII